MRRTSHLLLVALFSAVAGCSEPNHGVTAVHRAAAGGRTRQLADSIAMQPGSLDRPDQNGLTPLHAAVQGGHVGSTRILLAHKADPNSQASDGSTPLHFAAAKGSAKLTQMLLTAGANPNLKDRNGRTPHDVAKATGHVEVERVLERPKRAQ